MSDQRVNPEEIKKYAATTLKKWLKKIQATPKLRIWMRKRLDLQAGSMIQVDLSVYPAAKMKKINFSYRKKNTATDVLSFPADPFFQAQGILGDLVICAPLVLKQAREYQHAWKSEVDVLLVHGLLHLIHFDHELSEKAALEMSQWEKKLLGSRHQALIQRKNRVR